jgi:hypothetical protein
MLVEMDEFMLSGTRGDTRGEPASQVLARPGTSCAARSLLCLLLLVAMQAPGRAADSFFHSSQQTISRTPHPAVVRILSLEKSGTSYGSGSLVARKGSYGIVVTNWHVVRDVDGEILVTFPGGFRSTATILRTDRTWDLAALLVWSPKTVLPIPFARELPRPGDPLAIAGYGSGSFLAVAGTCKQYVAPGANLPSEMIELSAVARQGDSGGPILNQDGELVGVLFGAGWRSTSGSHVKRVQAFLQPVLKEFNSRPSQLAERSQLPSYRWQQTGSPQPLQGEEQDTDLSGAETPAPGKPLQKISINGTGLDAVKPLVPPAPSRPGPPSAVDQADAPQANPVSGSNGQAAGPASVTSSGQKPVETERSPVVQQTIHWKDLLGHNWMQQLKSLLAAIGAITILVQLARR